MPMSHWLKRQMQEDSDDKSEKPSTLGGGNKSDGSVSQEEDGELE